MMIPARSHNFSTKPIMGADNYRFALTAQFFEIIGNGFCGEDIEAVGQFIKMMTSGSWASETAIETFVSSRLTNPDLDFENR